MHDAKSLFSVLLLMKSQVHTYTTPLLARLGRMRICLACKFNPRIWQHSFVEIGHEIMIIVGQLSVIGEGMCST